MIDFKVGLDEESLKLEDFFASDSSPIELAKGINFLLALKGVDKAIPPQMIYNYIKKGYIEFYYNSTQKKAIKRKECCRFVAKYFAKNYNIELV